MKNLNQLDKTWFVIVILSGLQILLMPQNLLQIAQINIAGIILYMISIVHKRSIQTEIKNEMAMIINDQKKTKNRKWQFSIDNPINQIDPKLLMQIEQKEKSKIQAKEQSQNIEGDFGEKIQPIQTQKGMSHILNYTKIHDQKDEYKQPNKKEKNVYLQQIKPRQDKEINFDSGYFDIINERIIKKPATNINNIQNQFYSSKLGVPQREQHQIEKINDKESDKSDYTKSTFNFDNKKINHQNQDANSFLQQKQKDESGLTNLPLSNNFQGLNFSKQHSSIGSMNQSNFKPKTEYEITPIKEESFHSIENMPSKSKERIQSQENQQQTPQNQQIFQTNKITPQEVKQDEVSKINNQKITEKENKHSLTDREIYGLTKKVFGILEKEKQNLAHDQNFKELEQQIQSAFAKLCLSLDKHYFDRVNEILNLLENEKGNENVFLGLICTIVTKIFRDGNSKFSSGKVVIVTQKDLSQLFNKYSQFQICKIDRCLFRCSFEKIFIYNWRTDKKIRLLNRRRILYQIRFSEIHRWKNFL